MLDRSKWSFARSKFDSKQSPIVLKAISLRVIFELMLLKSCRILTSKNSTCFTNLPLPCELDTNLSIYAKKSQRIFLSIEIVSFRFHTETAGKHETWTKHKRLRWTVRFVCFDQWKYTETVINCDFLATRCKPCYITKSKQFLYKHKLVVKVNIKFKKLWEKSKSLNSFRLALKTSPSAF